MKIRKILAFIVIIGLYVFCVGCDKSDTESNEVNEKYDYDFDNDELYENGENTVHNTLMKQKENQDLELLDDIFLAIKVGLNTDALNNELQDLIPEKSMNKFKFEDLVAGNTEFDELNGIVKDKIGDDKTLVAECNKDCDIVIRIMNDDIFEICVYIATKEDEVVKCEYIKDDKDNFKEMLVCTTNLSEYKVIPDFYGLTETEAKDLLEKTEIIYVFVLENDSVVEKGKVFKQSIDAGTAVPKESEITIFLSDGVKEPIWLVQPTYTFEDVSALTERLPIDRLDIADWMDNRYVSRYLYKVAGKEGMVDLEGNILIDSSIDLHIDPRNCVVGNDYMKYDMDGNPVEYAGGGGGLFYCWNEFEQLIGVLQAGSMENNKVKYDSNPTMMGVQAVSFDLNSPDYTLPEVYKIDYYDYYRLVNSNSKLVIDEKFEDIKVDGSFNKNVVGKYAVVKKNGLWGYVSSDGNWLLECQFEDAYAFTNGIAAVKKDGKAGFINEDGSVAVDFIFEETRTTNEGKAWVKYEGKWGVIDIKAMME